MKHLLALFILAASLMGPVGDAIAQVAGFASTPEEFRLKFNEVAAADGSDRILGLEKNGNGYRAILADEKFRQSVADFNASLDTDAGFVMKTTVDLVANRDGRVVEIDVAGDRADPINLFQAFVGSVGVIARVLDPAITDDRLTKFIVSLGLMRTDDDPDIGKAVRQVHKNWAFNCLTRKSSVSTAVQCVITPDFL